MANPNEPDEHIDFLKGGYMFLVKNYLNDDETNELYEHLINLDNWAQSDLTMFGKQLKTPRLQFVMTDPSINSDTYSNNKIDWTEPINELRRKLEDDLDFDFNYLLLNLYRDGADYIGFHADNEVKVDSDLIASISIGGSRRFTIKEKKVSQSAEKYEFLLEDGDLVVMNGLMQKHYKHSIPKTVKPVSERINLTFRWAYN